MQGPKIEAVTPTLPLAAPAERASRDGNPAAAEAPVRPAPEPRAERQPPIVDMTDLHQQIARQLEGFLRESGRSLEFRVDDAANATVITVRRADTGEVVRQYPTEAALALLRRLNERSGTFLEEFA